MFLYEVHFYRGGFRTQIIHRYIYKVVFSRGYFYTDMPLHTDALRLHASSPGNFYMGEAGHAIQGRVQTILKLGFHPFSRVR
jgi:hypothetical protein